MIVVSAFESNLIKSMDLIFSVRWLIRFGYFFCLLVLLKALIFSLSVFNGQAREWE